MRNEGRLLRWAIAVSLAGAWVPIAGAGVVDNSLPVLSTGSSPARHIFTIPGVIKNNGLATIVSCTSLDRSKTFRFAVEVFGHDGKLLNDVSAPVLDGADTMVPGATRTIATGSTAGIHEDKIIAFGLADPTPDVDLPLRRGSARVVSESRNIACIAYVVVETGSPPMSLMSLKVVKARKQSGD